MTDFSAAASELSRRSILAGGIAVLSAPAAAISPRQPAIMPSEPRPTRGEFHLAEAAAWTHLVGANFVVAGGLASRMRLVEVQPLQNGGLRPTSVARNAAFSLLFEARRAGAITEGHLTCWIANESVAPMPIYFSSVHQDPDKLLLLAVFN